MNDLTKLRQELIKNNTEFPIFLDNQSTTRPDPRVVEKMLPYFQNKYGNVHSRSHIYGWNAEKASEEARVHVASLIGADPREIIFTSGATESNNTIIKGLTKFYGDKKNHIIVLSTEHKCLLDTCRYIESEGFNVTYLPVQENGLINLELLKNTITDKTLLVSVMAVHNEIGVIQPLKEIGAICLERNVFFHSDIAQAYGKIPIDVNEMNISVASISSHKIYGPQGIGALYIRRNPRVRVLPLINGGGQERGIRSGTLPLPLVVGFGEAARIASIEMDKDYEHVKHLSQRFLNHITNNTKDIIVNGDMINRYPGNLNISFAYIEGESMILAIKDLAVSSGSACTSASLEPSYVLKALGVDEGLAHTSIRFGFGRFNNELEIDYAALLVMSQIEKLRNMSPLWEMVQDGIDLNSIKWSAH